MSKVLIADDDRISCKLLASLLTKWGYRIEMAHNGDDALKELLKPDAPQLAILDWIMPGLDGIEVIKKLRAVQRESYVYILLLSSKGKKEDLLEGLDAGADDYLKKPFDAQELRARLRVGARILGLERRLASAMETPEYRATHDPLTGLYNRRSIIEALGREASRSDRAGQKLSVLIAEIDDFQELNETHGRAVCDQIIKQLAPKMSSDLRPHDSAGRFGAEQFLIVAPNCSDNHGIVVANRLRLAVARDKLAIGQLIIPVTVSVGISTQQDSAEDIHVTIQAAQSALSEAKNKGRNRVECYAPSEPVAKSGEAAEKNTMAQRS